MSSNEYRAERDHRRNIARHLAADESAQVDRFVGTIAREIPAYAELDDRQLQEVRSIIVWTLRRVLELWADDGVLTADDIQLFRGVGAVRARDGRPLAAVLRAYRVAAAEFFDQVADRFSRDVTVEDISSLVRVWFAVLDELSEAIYDGYESTGRLLGADRESSLRRLLADLLRGRQAHSGTLTARLRELDAELPGTFELIIVGPSPTLDAEQTATIVAPTVGPAGAGPMVERIVTVLDGVAVILARGMDAPHLDEVLNQHALRAVRQRRVTAGTAPRAYRLGLHALRRAPESAWSNGPTVDEGDCEVIALATGHDDADPARTVDMVLASLGDLPEARRTLETVLLADGAAPAADLLHVHPQTVRQRLRRITALTGRDPRGPWNRYVFQTALLAAVDGV